MQTRIERLFFLRSYVKKQKLRVIRHYSNGKMECACCKESIFEFLSIDHINNNGALEREKTGSGTGFYVYLIKHKYPSGYQVLCFNCNMAKGFYGECPHEEMRRLDKEVERIQENIDAHRRSSDR